MAAPPPRFPHGNLVPLLSQRNPDPEPANHLDKHKGEEDAVFKAVAAPAPGLVRRIHPVGRGMRHPATRASTTVQRGGGAEHEGIEDGTERQEEAKRSWRDEGQQLSGNEPCERY